jgi:hypothetical protein
MSTGATMYFLWAPGAVTDLRAYQGIYGRSVKLVWTAPGDDGYQGALTSGSKYAIQRSSWSSVVYSTSSLDTVYVSTSSVNPGSYQSYVLTSLQQGVTYYVRLWTADENVSWSDLSNSTSAWATYVQLSITLPTTWFSYGVLPTAVSTDTYRAALVRNSGNVYETYSIRATSTTDYDIGTSPGSDKFSLQALFRASRPATADFDPGNLLSLTDTLSTGSVFSYDGVYTGVGVDPFPGVPTDTDRNLWFKLSTPLSVSTTGYQSTYITITAQEAYP